MGPPDLEERRGIWARRGEERSPGESLEAGNDFLVATPMTRSPVADPHPTPAGQPPAFHYPNLIFRKIYTEEDFRYLSRWQRSEFLKTYSRNASTER